MANRRHTPEERGVRLHAAREALKQGSTEEIRRALAELPQGGRKAAELRQRMLSRLGISEPHSIAPDTKRARESKSASRETPLPSAGTKVQVSGGFKYYFTVASHDSSAPFYVQAKGGTAIITLNADHPALHDLVRLSDIGPDGDIEIHKGVRRLILAWAKLELDSKGGPHEQRLQQMREDIGRLMRDLAGE
jgi:hypothetical protein